MSQFSQTSRLSVTCPNRLTPYLVQELQALDYPILEERAAGVETEGSLMDAMYLNLTLQTAHRVHFLLKEYAVRSPEQLYKRINRMEWEYWLPSDGYLSVTGYFDHHTIKDTQYANLVVKDAIVDRLQEQTGVRPDAGSNLDRSVVFVYWSDEQCRVFLDTSGESLSRRGYRKNSHSAPLQETLASAIVDATDWQPPQHFINPMCGSGTLAIEAAMKALNIAPGLLRYQYGFQHIKGYRKAFYRELMQRLKNQAKSTFEGSIVATDRDPKAIKAAKANAERADVADHIEFSICDFRATPLPEGSGVVVLNPEYGERLGYSKKLEHTYESIGDFFKQECTNYTGYVFTGNQDLAKHIGLRTSEKTKFYNATIDCRLLKYELYEGSRK